MSDDSLTEVQFHGCPISSVLPVLEENNPDGFACKAPRTGQPWMGKRVQGGIQLLCHIYYHWILLLDPLLEFIKEYFTTPSDVMEQYLSLSLESLFSFHCWECNECRCDVRDWKLSEHRSAFLTDILHGDLPYMNINSWGTLLMRTIPSASLRFLLNLKSNWKYPVKWCSGLLNIPFFFSLSLM